MKIEELDVVELLDKRTGTILEIFGDGDGRGIIIEIDNDPDEFPVMIPVTKVDRVLFRAKNCMQDREDRDGGKCSSLCAGDP